MNRRNVFQPYCFNLASMRAFACLVLWSLSFSVLAAGNVQLNLLERQLLVSEDGIVSLRIEAYNPNSTAVELGEQVQVPAGWNIISTLAPFSLQAGARELRLIHIAIPRQSQAGSFTLHYQLAGLTDSSLLAIEPITVTVTPKAGTDLTRLSVPANLLEGEDYQAQFLLSNSGNSTQSYRVKLRDADGYAKDIKPNQFSLKAGAQQILTVTGNIPNSLKATRAHRFTILVQGRGNPIREVVDIPLITRTAHGVDEYHRLAGDLTTSYSTLAQKDALQSSQQHKLDVEYRLRGALDDAEEHRIDMRLQTGRDSNKPFTEVIQHYQVGYEHEDWKVKAGQQNFYTSRLAGNSLNGEGVEVSHRLRDDKQHEQGKVRAFYGQSRADASEQQKAAAITGEYHLSNQPVEVSGALLQTEEAGKSKRIVSGGVKWSGEKANSAAELAYDGKHKALALDGGMQWHDVATVGSYLEVDSDFQGANSDTRQWQLGSQWQANTDTRFSTTVRTERNNLRDDASREIRQTQEQQIQAQRLVGESKQIKLGVGYKQKQEQDLRADSRFKKDTKAAFVSYEQDFDAWQASMRWDVGQRHDALLDSKQSGQHQQLALSWRPNNDWRLNIDYNHNDRLDSDGKNHALGLQGEYQLDDDKRLSGYWQYQQSKDDRVNTLNLNYQQRLNERDKLAIQVGVKKSASSSSGALENASFRVDYTHSLDMPLRRRTDITSLCGIMTYADSQQPAVGLVLRLGQYSAVSNMQGQYCYKNILAKHYEMQLDSSRLAGKSYMLGTQGIARSIDLKAGQTNYLDLSLSLAASVTGQLRRWQIDGQVGKQQSLLMPADGVGGVVLELRSLSLAGEPVLIQRNTDADGNFSMLGIPPGRWQLRVLNPERLPEHHRLEQEQWQLELQAGQIEVISMKLLPQQETIEKAPQSNPFSVSG